MKSEITIERDDNILIRRLSGQLNAEMFIDFWEETKRNPLFDKEIKGVLTDYSNGTINVEEIDSLKVIYDYIEKNKALFSSYYFARVITSPKIIFAVIIDKDIPYMKGRSFSTYQAALDWLRKAISREEPLL